MKRKKVKEQLLTDLEQELENIRGILERKKTTLWEASKILDLLEVTKAITSTLNLNDLLCKVLEAILKVSNAQRGFLMLVEMDGELRVKAKHGINGKRKSFIHSKISKSVTRSVLDTGKPVFIKNIKDNAAFNKKESIIGLNLKMIMCIPLKVRRRVIGIIYVDSKSISQSLTESDLVFFEALTDHAAIAIENARLYEKAITDELTLLPNRSYIEMKLEEEMSRTARYNSSLSIIYIDVDGFKSINDRYGHLTGDSVLIQAGNMIKASLRRYDTLCRFGGDEFVAILPDTRRETAERVAKRMLNRFNKQKIEVRKKAIPLSISIGIGVFPHEASNKVELLDYADKEMYQMKREKGC